MVTIQRTSQFVPLAALLIAGLFGTFSASAQEATNHSTGSRLFVSPTARPIGDGNGYIAIYELFFPYVAYGVGDSVTLAGGMSINPGTGRFFYGGAKATLVDRPQAAFAVGAIGVLGVGAGVSGGAGILQAVGTRGGDKGALTLGAAFGVADGEIDGHPAIVIGGDRRLSDSIRFVTENYVFVGLNDGFMVSGGLRFVGDRLTGDFGLFTFPALLDELDGLPLFPWLGFAYSF